jgi:hypothetical protein
MHERAWAYIIPLGKGISKNGNDLFPACGNDETQCFA